MKVYLAVATLLLCLPSRAHADCFSDCMGTCWSSRSDENVSYCSGTEARCETECRHVRGHQKSYGAIAYSMKEGAYGFSDDWDNRQDAEKHALEACTENGPGCEVVVWFFDSCGAVVGSGTLVSWGQDAMESAARRKALEACAKQGGTKCNVKVSHCSN
ncbi:MAG: DUF4189 domain-containing protein [Bdellovibrionota bacterium]